MDEHNDYWASGNWRVTEGKGEEFIERWREFLTWTRQANDGFLGARLLRDATDPDHFVSFASWQGLESLNAWRQKPEFADHFGRCRALCTEMYGSNFDLVCTV